MDYGFESEPSRRGYEKNEDTAALLETAGLVPSDLEIFQTLKEAGFSTFLHGSITADRLTERSDIDFALVGDFAHLPSDMKDNLLPAASDDLLDIIHYVSTSQASENGRKMSLHIEKPEFRGEYPNIEKPYAYEYRPARHAKRGTSKYFCGGFDRNENIHLINFTCPREEYDSGTINVIPQTGLFYLEGSMAHCGGEYPTSFTIDHIATVDPNGNEVATPGSQKLEEIMLLGVEFDKMQSDRRLFRDDNSSRYVTMPIVRSVQAVGDFTDSEPTDILEKHSRLMSEYWDVAKASQG